MNITKKISLFLIISIIFQCMHVENIQARGARSGARSGRNANGSNSTTPNRKPKTKRQKVAIGKRHQTNQAHGRGVGQGNVQNPAAALGIASAVHTNQQQQQLMMAMEFCNNNPDDNRCNNNNDDISEELSPVTPTV